MSKEIKKLSLPHKFKIVLKWLKNHRSVMGAGLDVAQKSCNYNDTYNSNSTKILLMLLYFSNVDINIRSENA